MARGSRIRSSRPRENGLRVEGGSPGVFFFSLLRRAALLLLAMLLGSGSGCFFRRNKSSGPPLPPQPVQLMLLPLNVPDNNTDLQWVGTGCMVMLARELENAPDIEVLPLWRGLPVAIDALGTSRSVTPEIAAFAASRAGSKWATQGEISPSKDGVRVLLDFIPVKATMIAYRYEKETSIESLGSHYREAIEQFLRYLQVRPLSSKDSSSRTFDSARLKEISAAIDREYGWFTAADPGKAGSTFSSVAGTDDRLARILFNPALYAAPSARPATTAPRGTVPQPPSDEFRSPPTSLYPPRRGG